MGVADLTAQQSADEEIRVGCIIVRRGQILSQGWNGQPSGMHNSTRTDAGITYSTVIHSEANALMKLAKNGGGSEGATIYCTHSPCMNCSLLLLQAGISRVVYREVYERPALDFLKERGIEVEQVTTYSGVSDNQGW